MEKGRNKTAIVLGTVAAIGMLLSAFLVVWLVPREAGVGNANSQGSVGVGSVSGPSSGGVGSKDAAYQQGGFAQAGQVGAVMSNQPHISVRGTGIVSAKPDMLRHQLVVQEQDDTLDKEQTDAATNIYGIMNQLKAAGVDEKDISTAQYNVEPVMNYNENQPPTVTGYRVTNILNIKLRDLSKAGKLIDDLVKSGANSIYGLSFGFSDPTALMKQAREQAVNDAKARASELATLGGVTLGAPIAIDEGFANVPVPVMNAMPEQAQRDAALNTAIVPGQQEVRVEVSVVYGIK
ncbi:MAG TPA: SIMPL domain-containing protein [Chloroflexia bacterium]|nr:SIMPL domain-containing protein [Chloroflexia bacterium]